MTVSQVINHINEENYDVDITVTDVPKGYFIAVVSIALPEGSVTREIKVDMLQLEQAPGGTMTTNSGLLTRGPGEDSIHIVVSQDGTQLAENTQSYP
ncbi:MAG: hypothetical protein AB8H03_26035 [Saprospiraceae bacterium]